MKAQKDKISKQIEVPINTSLQCQGFTAFRDRDVKLEWENISEKSNNLPKNEPLPEKNDNISQSTNQEVSVELDGLDDIAKFYVREVNTNKINIDTHNMVIRSLFSLLKFFLELKVNPDVNLQPIAKQYFKKFILSERKNEGKQSLFIESNNLVGELLGN